MKRADVVFELIKKEESRQISGIELIASENFTSPYGSNWFDFDQ